MIFYSTQYFIPLKKLIIYVLFYLRTVFCYNNNNGNNNNHNNDNDSNNDNSNENSDDNNNKQILYVITYM